VPGSHVEELLQLLLDFKLFSINEKNPIKHATALHNAAYNGCAGTVKFLLDRGADTLLLNSKCGGETPLQSAELGRNQCKSANAEIYQNFDKCIELLKASCLSVQVGTPSSKKIEKKSSASLLAEEEEKTLLSPLSPEMSPVIRSLGVGTLVLEDETPHKKRSLSADDLPSLASLELLKQNSGEKSRTPDKSPDKSPDSKDTPGKWRTGISMSPAEKARRKLRSVLNIISMEKMDTLMTEICEIKIDPFDTKLQQDLIDIFITNLQQTGRKGVEEHYQTAAILTNRIYDEWSQCFLTQLINKILFHFEQPIDKEDEKQTKNIQHLAMFIGHLYKLDGCPAKVIHDVIAIYLSGTHTQFGTNLVCSILKLTGSKLIEKKDPKLKEYVSKLTLLKPNFTKQTSFAIEDVIAVIAEN
jgi:hypothetical protein